MERKLDFMNANQKRIKHEQDYIEFLDRRVKSANYKKNVSPEEYAETEAKLKKARLVMRVQRRSICFCCGVASRHCRLQSL